MTDTIYKVHHGKMEEVLLTTESNRWDSCVTDPPYGLSFMNKKWDYKVPSVEQWKEAYRVLKPGGYLLSFGGSRTFHRMWCNIEDAGFEIRDTIMWLYSQGFPKSHNLDGEFEGWGSALKPSFEPILIARKPLDGTIAENMSRWGTGAMNIDACRIDLNGDYKSSANGRPSLTGRGDKYDASIANQPSAIGRWPANVIHDGSNEVLELFPESKGQQGYVGPEHGVRKTVNAFGDYGARPHTPIRGDKGSAARFFYCAKTSRSDREEGVMLEKKPMLWSSGTENPGSFQSPGTENPGSFQSPGTENPGSFQSPGTEKAARNNHPTVKPTALMQYLIKLVTKKGGLVGDPFAGSGSTGKACMKEQMRFEGVEMDEHHVEIAKQRIEHAMKKYYYE